MCENKEKEKEASKSLIISRHGNAEGDICTGRTHALTSRSRVRWISVAMSYLTWIVYMYSKRLWAYFSVKLLVNIVSCGLFGGLVSKV